MSTVVAPAGPAATGSAAFHVIEAFCALGVEYLFCNLGTDHAPLVEELARRRGADEPAPAVILCPHENTAVHMAAGYAAATGRGQAVLVHVDAGTANAAMGLHNLARFRLPVLLLAGRAPYSTSGTILGGRNSYVNFVQQPFDQGSLVRPYVKWEYDVPSSSVASEAVLRAHQRMQAVPQGPVYLTVARETLAEAAPGLQPPRPHTESNQGVAAPEPMAELVRRLLRAERPLIITAYAGRDPLAMERLDALARLAGIRVIEHVPHTVNLPHESPCHGGFSPEGHVETADVGLLIDVDVPWIPARTQPAPNSWWTHIDSDVHKPNFPMWNFPADQRLEGHTASMLGQLLDALRAAADASFRARARARLESLMEQRERRRQRAAATASEPGLDNALNPAYVCAALARALAPDDVVLNEAVRHAPLVFEHLPRSMAGTRVGPAGGGLGYSAGMALGIKLARPESVVVNVVGDGTFYFGNPQSAFAVSMRYGLPVLTVVLDNGGWAAVKEATARVYPEGEAQRLADWHAELGGNTDFAMVARAAGGHGERVVHLAQVEGAIQRCLQSVRAGRLAVLHVSVPNL